MYHYCQELFFEQYKTGFRNSSAIGVLDGEKNL